MSMKQAKKWLRKQWLEWRGVVYFTVFVMIPVRSILADWNWVPTGSMNPTILEGDLVFVNKAAYDVRVPLTRHRLIHRSDPSRGDIVVLFSPADEVRLVKRVVGLPGDTIEMRANVLFINDEKVNYLPLDTKYTTDLEPGLKQHSIFAQEDLPGKSHAVMAIPGIAAFRDIPKTVIPNGQYFVMGDNRDNSKDSRYFGFVERGRIVGRAQGVIVSFNKLEYYQPRPGRFFTGLE